MIHSPLVSEDFAKSIWSKFDQCTYEVNSFSGPLMEFSELPKELQCFIIESVSDDGFELVGDDYNKNRKYIDHIPSGCVEFQMHTISVTPHTDDIHPKIHFFVLPIAVVNEERNSKTIYCDLPRFQYYDSVTSKKSYGALYERALIFNPRKEHSVYWCGSDYIVMMLSVVRK